MKSGRCKLANARILRKISAGFGVPVGSDHVAAELESERVPTPRGGLIALLGLSLLALSLIAALGGTRTMALRGSVRADYNYGQGYALVGSDGSVYRDGIEGFYGSETGQHLNAPIVGIATVPSGGGYWFTGSDGGVFSYGNASYYGSMGGQHLNKPVVGMASTPDGLGYWLVAADGGIFNYGDAGFFGSAGSLQLNKPIVGMAPTPDGAGYWLVAADGGIFAYGDATFYGSTSGDTLNAPIVGMAALPNGSGYWLVGSDGGIYSEGAAQFYGSQGSTTPLPLPIVGMASSPDGNGYWLAGSDGGVVQYGDAQFVGEITQPASLAGPIVGISAPVRALWTTNQPTSTVDTEGPLDVFSVSVNGQVFGFQRTGLSWTNINITNSSASSAVVNQGQQPSTVVGDPNNGLDVFASGTNGHLYQFARNTSTNGWSAYDVTYILGTSAAITGSTSAILDPGGTLDVFAHGTNGHLYEFARNQTTLAWTLYDVTSLIGTGNTIGGGPFAFVNIGSALIATAPGSNGHVYEFARNPSTYAWTLNDVTSLTHSSANVTARPWAIIDPSGSLDLFDTGTNGHLYQFSQNSGTGVWTGYDISSMIGTNVTLGNAAVPIVGDPNNGLDVFATGTNGQLYQFGRNPSNYVWTLYDVTSMAGSNVVLVAGPVQIFDPLGGLDAFGNATGGQMYQFGRNPTTFAWSVYNITSLS